MAEEMALLEEEQPITEEAEPTATVEEEPLEGEETAAEEVDVEALHQEVETLNKRVNDNTRYTRELEAERNDLRSKLTQVPVVQAPAETAAPAAEFDQDSLDIIDERTQELIVDLFLEEPAARAKAEAEERRAIKREQRAAATAKREVMGEMAPLVEMGTMSTVAQEVATVLASDPAFADLPTAKFIDEIAEFNRSTGPGAFQRLDAETRRQMILNRAPYYVGLKALGRLDSATTESPVAPAVAEKAESAPRTGPPAQRPPASPTAAATTATRTNAAREQAANQYAQTFAGLRNPDGTPSAACYELVDENKQKTGNWAGTTAQG